MTQPECFTTGHNFPRCLASQELLRFITNTSSRVCSCLKRCNLRRDIARARAITKHAFGYSVAKSFNLLKKKKKQSSPQNNQKKQLTFRQYGFPAKCRVRNECGKSTLMTSHYPDLGSVVFMVGRAAREICLTQSDALPRSG